MIVRAEPLVIDDYPGGLKFLFRLAANGRACPISLMSRDPLSDRPHYLGREVS
jgi:hypothetical protein